MRGIFAALLSSLLAVPASAQVKHPVDLFISGSWIDLSVGGPDSQGFSFAAGANWHWFPSVTLSANYRSAGTSTHPGLTDYTFNSKSANFGELQINIYPFELLNDGDAKDVLRGFHAAFGPSVVAAVMTQSNGNPIRLDPDRGYAYDPRFVKYERIHDLGYALTLGYDIAVAKRFFAGARIDVSQYLQQDGYNTLGVVLGYKMPETRSRHR